MTEEQARGVFHFLILVCSVTAMPQNLSLQERIPIYLQELCPGTGVCLNDVIDPEDKEPSCCGECSCSIDCEESGNCCFHEVEPVRFNSECLYPCTQPHKEMFPSEVHQSYYMVSSSPDDPDCNERANTSVTCGDVRVAPWGTMLPVYSKQTGKIYKNKVCADAFNVTDGEVWDVYLSCDPPDELFDQTSFIHTGALPDFCKIEFSFNKSLIRSEQCYKHEDFLYKCSLNTNISFEVPNVTSATADDIVEACKSGLVSPYMDTYINVFCFICTHHAILPRCYDKFYGDNLVLMKSMNKPLKFTFIFDTNTFSNDLLKDYTKSGNTRIACPVHSDSGTKAGCRPISCPSGQILNRSMSCIYTGNKWIIDKYYIYITLSSKESVSVSSLSRSVLNLKSPWPKYWTINTISYEATAGEMQTRSLVVLQHVRFHSPFNPEHFFKKFKKYVYKPWRLVSNNRTITLQARISNFVHRSDRIEHTHHVIADAQGHHAPRVKKHITKLYLCDHVTLLQTEYSLISYGVLFNKLTQQTLYSGEFTMKHDGREMSPGVCLENSGLYKVQNNNSIRVFPGGISNLCVVVIAIHFLQLILFVRLHLGHVF